MANGTTVPQSLSVRMWRAAREDVSPNGNVLDELRFVSGYLAAELEKAQTENAELKSRIEALERARQLDHKRYMDDGK